MFDLKQLRCFIAVGEELHFGRAARRINMTQPPLSRQIQLLEHELQVELIARTSRSVKLTPAGKAFMQEAARILGLAESAGIIVKRIANGNGGLVRLGFTAGSSYEFLPKLLTKMAASLKDTELVLTEMVTKQQIEALRTNSIDLGLHRMPTPQEGFETIRVARERMMLAVPLSHRLAKGRLPDLDDLAGEPFITFPPQDGYYFYHLIDSFFTPPTSPTYVQYVSQIHSILALVSAGIGVAMVPESAQLMRYRGIVLRHMKRSPPRAELHLVWNKGANNPAISAVAQLVRQHFQV